MLMVVGGDVQVDLATVTKTLIYAKPIILAPCVASKRDSPSRDVPRVLSALFNQLRTILTDNAMTH